MATLSLEQRNLFDALHKSKIEDLKTFNKREYKGFWSSIIDKYPETAHFVYELLQNADDAEASEVYIILNNDSLFFKHNGKKHFDVTPDDACVLGDINSITGIGASTKEDIHNKIGKFGVGFKAVFQYTDCPEIYDDYFKFKIENNIVPTLLPYDHPYRNEGETLFVIPFKEQKKSFKDIKDRLENLKDPILFLRNLQRIVWRIDKGNISPGEEYEYSKQLLDRVEHKKDKIIFEHYKLTDPNKTHEIFLFSKNISISDKNDKVQKHLISVGFYYDSIKKKLITDIVQNIYCFFPTKESFNTCFVSHAPFLLTDNRQNLKPSESFNKKLIDLLAELATKAILYLRDYQIDEKTHLINENITEIIPKYKEYYWEHLDDLFQEPIVNAFKNLLDNERILLSRNGKYISIREAYISTPKELALLLSQNQLISFLNDYVEEEDLLKLQNVDFLKMELADNITKQGNNIYDNIESFKSENLADYIDEDFMAQQEFGWVIKFYTYLRNNAPKLWRITDLHSNYPFREAPIIKTQKGEWVQPFINTTTPNVYLPLKDDNKSDYNFIAKEYLENTLAMKFFSELEIKEPNELDYIREVILSKYEEEDVTIEYDDLKSDFLVLLHYFREVKDNEVQCKDYINLLKENLLLYATDEYLHSPEEIYIYNKTLEKYFVEDECCFIDLQFYEIPKDKFNDNIIREFLITLGVHVYPKVIEYTDRDIDELSEQLQLQIEKANYYSIYEIEDFELEGFEALCNSNSLTLELSLYLWNEVIPSINFSSYECLKIEFRNKRKRNSEYGYYNSSFKDALLHNNWLYDVNGNLASAKTIKIEELHPEYNRNNGLINFLCIGRRERTIVELGGSQRQQEAVELGEMALSSCNGNYEEAKQLLSQLYKLKKQNSKNSSVNVDITSEEESTHTPGIERQFSPSNAHSSTLLQDVVFNNASIQKPFNIPSSFIEDVISREELRTTDSSNMFVGAPPIRENKSLEEDEENEEEEVDAVMQQLIDEEEKHNKIIELTEIAHSAEKYSKEWFEALIELEYRGGVIKDNQSTDKAITISFTSISKEPGSDRIYIFRNPSRGVPMWMEEVEDFEVKCSFSDKEDIKLKFEVANVRENSLRLKASKAYEQALNKIEWSKFTKATITLKNQIDLMGKLRTAFSYLDLEDGDNLKDNLEDNLKFIFGPPGTGKTTTLAKKIIAQMDANLQCKILVLAPTNTACDELARKIQEKNNNECPWLSRFVATADESLEDIVIDRESMAYDNDQCCIISTIARLSFDGFNGIGGNNRLTDIVWDMVICDEASMIPLAEIMLAVYTFTNTPFLIAGDPMQIKPILQQEEWKDENIYTMVHLDRFDNPKTEPIQFDIENLGVQYRSVPSIGELFSQYAYDGKLKHYRSNLLHKNKFGQLELKPINFIPFKVEKYDSIFGVKKLDGSNVHIYSALFTVEFFKFLVREYSKESQKDFSIGIVCPYAPQAQMIENLILQIPNIPINIHFVVGTVHRFQGGQCNLIIVVLNPPLGLKTAPHRIFLNNKNILNVAISRAEDNLCLLLPHRDTDGYENLYEINNLGRIAMNDPSSVATYTCDQIEEMMFGRKFFIESNTFVTSHQLANVYSIASKRYEVRIDDKAVDIQLGCNTTI